MAMNNFLPIDSIHNVIGVITRDMLAKKIPSSSQPIIMPLVFPPIESSGLEKEPVMSPVVNLPIDIVTSHEILGNSLRASFQSQPPVQPLVNESYTTGMP